jgi:hypothetical protein
MRRKNLENDVFFTTFCDALIKECTTTGSETLRNNEQKEIFHNPNCYTNEYEKKS